MPGTVTRDLVSKHLGHSLQGRGGVGGVGGNGSKFSYAQRMLPYPSIILLFIHLTNENENFVGGGQNKNPISNQIHWLAA